MNPKYKQSWLNALKSCKFKKGTSLLYNTDNKTYCALGVLCAVSGVPLKLYKNKHYLPLDIRKEFGLDDTKDRWGVIRRNDKSKDFQSVILFIEQNL